MSKIRYHPSYHISGGKYDSWDIENLKYIRRKSQSHLSEDDELYPPSSSKTVDISKFHFKTSKSTQNLQESLIDDYEDGCSLLNINNSSIVHVDWVNSEMINHQEPEVVAVGAPDDDALSSGAYHDFQQQSLGPEDCYLLDVVTISNESVLKDAPKKPRSVSASRIPVPVKAKNSIQINSNLKANGKNNHISKSTSSLTVQNKQNSLSNKNVNILQNTKTRPSLNLKPANPNNSNNVPNNNNKMKPLLNGSTGTPSNCSNSSASSLIGNSSADEQEMPILDLDYNKRAQSIKNQMGINDEFGISPICKLPAHGFLQSRSSPMGSSPQLYIRESVSSSTAGRDIKSAFPIIRNHRRLERSGSGGCPYCSDASSQESHYGIKRPDHQLRQANNYDRRNPQVMRNIRSRGLNMSISSASESDLLRTPSPYYVRLRRDLVTVTPPLWTPSNFGIDKQGQLVIDYSHNWNGLESYIKQLHLSS